MLCMRLGGSIGGRCDSSGPSTALEVGAVSEEYARFSQTQYSDVESVKPNATRYSFVVHSERRGHYRPNLLELFRMPLIAERSLGFFLPFWTVFVQPQIPK